VFCPPFKCCSTPVRPQANYEPMSRLLICCALSLVFACQAMMAIPRMLSVWLRFLSTAYATGRIHQNERCDQRNGTFTPSFGRDDLLVLAKVADFAYTWYRKGMRDWTLSELTAAVTRHRDERDWRQFHTPKELAVSLCVEAAELLGLMQWKSGDQLEATVAAKRQEIADELSDVLHSVLLLAGELQIPLGDALLAKLAKDAHKYPIHKSKGKNIKYNEL
jgi:dCTP diphosphatase